MDVAREVLEASLESSLRDSLNMAALDPPEVQQQEVSATSSSFYTLASDQSVFSRDVDHWIRGSSIDSTGVQGTRVPVRQRPQLVADEAVQASGFWYILALILPLFSCSHSNRWRCSPSTILHTAEFFVTQIGRACRQIRCHIRRLATNQMSRELVATAMDVVLVVYAIGFLILSMKNLEEAFFLQHISTLSDSHPNKAAVSYNYQ